MKCCTIVHTVSIPYPRGFGIPVWIPVSCTISTTFWAVSQEVPPYIIIIIWFPTTSRLAAASAPVVLPFVLADRLPPRKRLRDSPAVSYQDVTIEATIEPISPPVHHGLTVEERLDDRVDDSTRVALQTARGGLTEMRLQMRDTVEQLQQCLIARMHDKERISRIEDYLLRYR
ncbi:hypothetical protein Tco_1215696 [Tanacetum coccineum]